MADWIDDHMLLILIAIVIIAVLVEKTTEKAKGDNTKYRITIRTWRRLTKQMSASQVKSLLGEPKNVTVANDKVTWLYAGKGSVTFVNDRLTAWNEPQINLLSRLG